MKPIRAISAAALAAVAIVATTLVARSIAPQTDPCNGARTTDVRHGVAVCVHASEPPPAGVSLHERPTLDQLQLRRFGSLKHPAFPARGAKSASAAATQVSPSSSPTPNVAGDTPSPTPSATDTPTVNNAGSGQVDCIGTGTDGKRIQAVYAHASDVPDRFSSLLSMIRQYAADADYQVDVSAGESGQGRRVRFVTDSNCALDVADVTLSSGGDDTFSATRSELQAKGYNRSDRHYLVWEDASVGICGLGELYADDSPDASSNANNFGPAYARVDAPCWGYAEAHELLHTLGAVQNSAPHSTLAGHCYDENDTMCYTDTSGDAMQNDCPSMPSWQVDCGLDDYFNAAPAAGTYLATHWDVASSGFLEGAPPPPTPPKVTVHTPTSFYAGNAQTVSVSVTVPLGRTYTIAWTSSRSDCKYFHSTGTTNTFYCPVTSAGGGQVTARITDSLGMSNTSTVTYTLKIPSHPRYTIATVSSSTTHLHKGHSTTLTGKLRDASTLKAVIGMRVTIYYRKSGSSHWYKLTTRTTGKTGTFSMSVHPTKTTSYQLVSWSTRTWRSDSSSIRTIHVS